MNQKTKDLLFKSKKGHRVTTEEVVNAVSDDLGDLKIIVDRLTQVASETLEAAQRLTILFEQHIDMPDGGEEDL